MKKLYFIVLSVIGLCTLSIQTFSVFASPTSSQGSASFIENDEKIDPVDPTNPTLPIRPTHPGTEGPLSINGASDYQFGTQKMTDKDALYSAELAEITYIDSNKKVKVPNFLEITDNRGGQKGWRLEVRQEKPFTNVQGFELVGTRFIFSNIQMVSLTGGGTAPITSKVPIVLEGDIQSNTSVVHAKVETGGGSWGIIFGTLSKDADKSVQLHIPGNTAKQEGIYQTKLVWSLVDGV